MTTEIYLDMKKSVPPDLGYASAFSVVLLLLAAILLYFYPRLSRNAARFHTITGRGFRLRQFELGRVRYLGDAFVLLNFALVLVVPSFALLWLSLMPFNQAISLAMFDLWGNGQGTELAAFGLVWTAMMTVVACGLYAVARQVGASGFGA